MNLIDLGQVTDTLRWFELSISSSRGRTYRVEIKETINCTFEFFNLKNTPCKHILYVYLNVLNVSESSYLLQPLYLTKKRVAKYFPSKSSYLKRKYKTNRSCDSPITSTLTQMAVPPQENVPLNQSLPAKPFMPEPQNDPYLLLKRTGNILKYHGCNSDLDNYVLGRIECDFFPLIQKGKSIRVWFPNTSPSKLG